MDALSPKVLLANCIINWITIFQMFQPTTIHNLSRIWLMRPQPHCPEDWHSYGSCGITLVVVCCVLCAVFCVNAVCHTLCAVCCVCCVLCVLAPDVRRRSATCFMFPPIHLQGRPNFPIANWDLALITTWTYPLWLVGFRFRPMKYILHFYSYILCRL